MFSERFTTIAAECVILIPALAYLFWGRPYRRNMVLGYFTPNAIADYFDQFWAGSDHYSAMAKEYRERLSSAPECDQTCAAQAKLKDSLCRLYDQRFGWRSYAVPIVLLATVLFIALDVVVPYCSYLLEHNAATLNSQSISKEELQRFQMLPDNVVVAALAGAYLWLGLSLIARVGSLTLLPSDICYYSLRLAVAPMMGYALSAFAGDAQRKAALVAFVVALLPVSDFVSWARSLTAKALNISDSPQEVADKVTNLAGVDSEIGTRLQDQGVTTIKQLAEIDPVQISMRSGLEFPFIVSLVDQAIAWLYLGRTLASLNTYGWTGATDMIATADTLLEDATPLLTGAAIAYARAQSQFEAANSAMHGIASSDPEYCTRQAALNAAQEALVSAERTLANSATPPKVIKLLEEMAAKPDLKLSTEGLANVLKRLSSDGYARFIARLMREIQPQPATMRDTRPAHRRIFNAFGNVIGRGGNSAPLRA